MLWLDLVLCKSPPGGTGFEGMKRSCRAAKVWDCERPWKATCEGAATVAADGPGLNGSCKGVGKEEASDNVIEEGAVFQLLQVAELGSFGHVALAV